MILSSSFSLVSSLFDVAVILAAATVQSWFSVAALSCGRRTDFPYLRPQFNSIAGGAQRVCSQRRCEMSHTAHYFGNGQRAAQDKSFASAGKRSDQLRVLSSIVPAGKGWVGGAKEGKGLRD